MESLRKVFESLGFSKVTTFIASGNVIFETTTKNIKSLEKKIEKALHEALGYEVRPFIRSSDAHLRSPPVQRLKRHQDAALIRYTFPARCD